MAAETPRKDIGALCLDADFVFCLRHAGVAGHATGALPGDPFNLGARLSLADVQQRWKLEGEKYHEASPSKTA